MISRETVARLFSSSGNIEQTIAVLDEAAKGSTSDVLTSAKLTTLPLQGVTLTGSINVVRREVPAYNVVGVLDGSDPVRKNEANRIMKIAGRDVHNVYDYTYALGEMKAGQE